MRAKTLAVAALGLALAGTAAHAATIIYAGSLIDLGGGWRTPSVPKGGFDIQEAGVLGADGWFVAGNGGSTSAPAFVTAIVPNGSVFGGNGGYALIDDPTTTPGATPSQIQPGTLNPFPGPGAPVVSFTFVVGPSPPASFQVGVMEDNLDIAAYNASAVQLAEPLGGGSTVVSLTGSTQNDRVPDWYFFDVLGAVAGETFFVIDGGGPNGCGCLGAVSFDSNVPEPGTWTLMILGAGAVGGALRLQRRMRTALQSRS